MTSELPTGEVYVSSITFQRKQTPFAVVWWGSSPTDRLEMAQINSGIEADMWEAAYSGGAGYYEVERDLHGNAIGIEPA